MFGHSSFSGLIWYHDDSATKFSLDGEGANFLENTLLFTVETCFPGWLVIMMGMLWPAVHAVFSILFFEEPD
jgi:hypothetical protein